ncbi:MAG: GntR family transcriptional regulator [Planctomycetota bacterium]
MSDTKSQRQRVIDALQKGILDGRLKPGEALRQIPLAEEYGVSQTLIRESLQTLENRGLVTGTKNQGVTVRNIGKEELADAYRVREVLEGLAARLCCRKASRDDIDRLRHLAQQIHATSGRRSRRKRSELEYEFHQTFLTLSGNETLQRLSLGYRFVGNLVVTERDADELLDEHLAIVAAIESNQPERAEQLARRHIALSTESILNAP